MTSWNGSHGSAKSARVLRSTLLFLVALFVVALAIVVVWFPGDRSEMPHLLAIRKSKAAPGEDVEAAFPVGPSEGDRSSAHTPFFETDFEMPLGERERVEPASAASPVSPRKRLLKSVSPHRQSTENVPTPFSVTGWTSARSLSRKEQHIGAVRKSAYNLVEDLRDDDVRWNATAAAKELIRRMHDPMQYDEVWRELERALHSPDQQQSRIATGLLHSLSKIRHAGVTPYVPSERLLDLTADRLDHWDCWYRGSWIPGDVDDEKTVAFTIDHLERMEERLAAKLTMYPTYKRFIPAYILGREGRGYLAPLIAPILVERLRDNNIRDDALMSMEALFRIGAEATPWIREAIANADAQQRDCIELLLWELTDPAVTPRERAKRRHLNKVTWKCDNPVQSWHYDIPAEY